LSVKPVNVRAALLLVGNSEMADDTGWVQSWQAGDERAAETLYHHYRERTYRLAFGLLGDSGDAEEAAQDALTYALLNIKRYDPERARFSTWLHMITVSRCRDRYRRRRNPALSLDAWFRRGGEVEDETPGPEDFTIQAETRGQVWRAVQELDRDLREAIVLRYWAGHTYREMGEILGCPLRTAQSRVRLAFQRLHSALDPADLKSIAEEKAL
jgi:RNA polymerase sigma-70 factor (ECF subfamily)